MNKKMVKIFLLTLFILLASISLVSASNVNNTTISMDNGVVSSTNGGVSSVDEEINSDNLYVNDFNNDVLESMNMGNSSDVGKNTSKNTSSLSKLSDGSSDVDSIDTLKTALANAKSSSGTYTITFTDDFTSTEEVSLRDSNVLIDGNGKTITCSGSHRFMKIDNSNVTIINTTFTNFCDPYDRLYSGGVLYVSFGNLSVYNSTFTNNKADKGGVIYYSSEVTGGNIQYNNFTKNSDDGSGGGVIYYNSKVSGGNVTNNNFTNNGGEYGAVIYYSTEVTGGNIQYNNFTNNHAYWEGGVIYYNGKVSGGNVTNNNFTKNGAPRLGGVLRYNGEVSGGNVSYNSFTENKAEYGGAIYYDNSRDEISPTGGVVTYNNFTSNTALRGGAICYNFRDDDSKNGTVDGGIVDSNNFINNTATNKGGAIYYDVNVTGGNLTNNKFLDNYAPNEIIYYNCDVTGGIRSDNIFSGRLMVSLDNIEAVNIGESVVISGKVTFADTSVAGATVNMRINGTSVYSTTTTSDGSFTYTIPTTVAMINTLNINATIINDYIYNSTNNTATFMVNPNSTSIRLDDINAVQIGENIIIKGSVLSGNILINGATVNIRINGVLVGTTKTLDDGTFTYTYKTLTVGNNTIIVNATTTNSNYTNTSNINTSFMVNQNSSVLNVDDISSTQVGDIVTIKGSVTDNNGNLLKNVVISYSINGTDEITETISTGSFTLKINTQVVGLNTLTLTVVDTGNVNYTTPESATSKTFNVLANTTWIKLDNIDSVQVGDSVRISGTLYGLSSNTPLTGAKIQVQITSPTTSAIYTATTDNDGIFSAYVPTISVGENTVEVTVTDTNNINYTTSSTTSTFNVLANDTIINLDTINDVILGETVTISGTVTNTLLTPLNGVNVKVLINDSTEYMATTINGRFEVSIPTTVVGVNTANVTVTNTNNPLYINGSNSLQNFTVNKIAIIVTINTVNTTIFNTTTVTGVLLDVNNEKLGGKTLTVSFDGTTETVTTNDDGEYTATFTTTHIGENLPVSVSFTEDDTYANITNTSTLSVFKRNTTITVDDIESATLGESITIQGTLKDIYDTPISNALITINIDGTRYTANTDTNGEYELDYTLTSAGSHTITAMFNDTYNTTYNISNVASTSFNTPKLDTQLTITALDTFVGGNVTVSGVLTDENNLPISLSRLIITYNNLDYATSTMVNGSYTLSIPTSTTTTNTNLPISVSYEGNNNYLSSTNSTTFNVNKIKTSLTLNIIESNSNVIITGVLLREDGQTVPNKELTIKYSETDTQTVTTDDNGLYTYTITGYVGEWISVEYSNTDDSVYDTCSINKTYSISKVNPILIVRVVKEDVIVGDNAIIIATLFDPQNKNVITGQNLMVILNGETFNMTLDGEGQIQVNNITDTLGINNITITYPGNDTLNTITVSKTFNVIQRNTILTINNISTVKYGQIINISGTLTTNQENITDIIILTVNNNEYIVNVVDGKYNYTLTADTVGQNNITVTYAGSTNYNRSQVNTTFTVEKTGTQIILDITNTTIFSGDETTITILLTDEFDNPLANTELTLNVNNQETSITTNDLGVYQYTITGTTIGQNNITVTYPQSSNYLNTIKSITFTVNRIPTSITMNTLIDNGILYITGVLRNNHTQEVISNEVINIIIKSSTDTKEVSNTTNINGIYQYTLALPITTYDITVNYTGNTIYDTSINTTPITIGSVTTTLTIDDIKDSVIFDNIIISGILYDAHDNPISDANITLRINNNIITTTTTSTNGSYTFTYKTTNTGRHNITLTYNGNTDYKAVTNTTIFFVEIGNNRTVTNYDELISTLDDIKTLNTSTYTIILDGGVYDLTRSLNWSQYNTGYIHDLSIIGQNNAIINGQEHPTFIDVYRDYTLKIENITFTNFKADNRTSAIINNNGTSTLNNTTFKDNNATLIYNDDGQTTLNNTNVTDNNATLFINDGGEFHVQNITTNHTNGIIMSNDNDGGIVNITQANIDNTNGIILNNTDGRSSIQDSIINHTTGTVMDNTRGTTNINNTTVENTNGIVLDNKDGISNVNNTIINNTDGIIIENNNGENTVNNTQITNTEGTIIDNTHGNVNVDKVNITDTTGTVIINTDGEAKINNTNIDNTHSNDTTNGTVIINKEGTVTVNNTSVNNTHGTIMDNTHGTSHVDNTTVNNTNGAVVLNHNGTNTVNNTNINNTNGTVVNNTNGKIEVDNSDINNTIGVVLDNIEGTADINTTTVNNTHGNTTVNGTVINNNKGNVTVNNTIIDYTDNTVMNNTEGNSIVDNTTVMHTSGTVVENHNGNNTVNNTIISDTTGTIVNNTQGDIEVDNTNITNTTGVVLDNNGGNADINTTNVDNTTGTVINNNHGEVNVNNTNVTNTTGTVMNNAEGNSLVDNTNVDNTSGTVVENHNGNNTVNNANITNTNGTVVNNTNGYIEVDNTNINNTTGVVLDNIEGTADINTTTVNNTHGNDTVNGTVINNNKGNVTVNNTVIDYTDNTVMNNTEGNSQVDNTTVIHTSGTVVENHNGNNSVNNTRISDTTGTIVNNTNGNIEVDNTNITNTTGVVLDNNGGNADINTTRVNNTNGTVINNNNGEVNVTHTVVDNTSGTVMNNTMGNSTVDNTQVNNTSGTVVENHNGNNTVNNTEINNTNGTVVNNTNGYIEVDNTNINNTTGVVLDNIEGTADINTTTVNNTHGNTTVNGTVINNNKGNVTVNNTIIDYTDNTVMNNTNGNSQVDNTTVIHTTGTVVENHNGNNTVNNTRISDTEGTIVNNTNGNIEVDNTNITNTTGTILDNNGGNADINTTRVNNTNGTVINNNNGEVTVNNTNVTNTTGTVMNNTSGNSTVDNTNVDNTNGTVIENIGGNNNVTNTNITNTAGTVVDNQNGNINVTNASINITNGTVINNTNGNISVNDSIVNNTNGVVLDNNNGVVNMTNVVVENTEGSIVVGKENSNINLDMEDVISILPSESIVISGNVTSDDGLLLNGVILVSIDGINTGVYTLVDGRFNFTLTGLGVGDHKIIITYSGYNDTTRGIEYSIATKLVNVTVIRPDADILLNPIIGTDIFVGDSVSISGIVTSEGIRLQEVPITIIINNNTFYTVTDGMGNFNYDYTTISGGDYTVIVSYNNSMANTSFVARKIGSQINVTSVSDEYGNINITGVLRDENNNAINSAIINVYIDGTLVARLSSDENGTYNINTVIHSNGNKTITVTYEGNNTYNNITNNTTILVYYGNNMTVTNYDELINAINYVSQSNMTNYTIILTGTEYDVSESLTWYTSDDNIGSIRVLTLYSDEEVTINGREHDNFITVAKGYSLIIDGLKFINFTKNSEEDSAIIINHGNITINNTVFEDNNNNILNNTEANTTINNTNITKTTGTIIDNTNGTLNINNTNINGTIIDNNNGISTVNATNITNTTGTVINNTNGNSTIDNTNINGTNGTVIDNNGGNSTVNGTNITDTTGTVTNNTNGNSTINNSNINGTNGTVIDNNNGNSTINGTNIIDTTGTVTNNTNGNSTINNTNINDTNGTVIDNTNGTSVMNDTVVNGTNGTVISDKINTILDLDSIPHSILLDESLVINGVLKDANDVLLANKDLTIIVGGDKFVVTTGENGHFTYTYTPVSSGNYTLKVIFNGTSEYAPCGTYILFEVENKTSTHVTTRINITTSNITVGNQNTISGVLTDNDNNPLADKTVTIILNGVIIEYIRTGSDGSYTYNTTDYTSGSNVVTVLFDGDNTYLSSSASTTFTATRIANTISVVATNVILGASSTISGNVTANGTRISGRIVSVYINGELLVNTTTKSTGGFTAEYTANTTGNYIVSVSIAETTNYTASDNSTTFTVNTTSTTLTVSSTTANVTRVSTINGTLKAGNTNIANARIIINVNGQNVANATTNNNGVYSYNYTTSTVGANTVSVFYNGNNTYTGSNATRTLTVNKIATTLSLSLGSLHVGENTFNGNLTNGLGTRVANAVVSITSSGVTRYAITNSTGGYTVNWTVTSSGSKTFVVTYAGNGTYNNTTRTTTATANKLTARVTVSSIKARINDTVTLRATVVGSDGKNATNGTVTFLVNGKNMVLNNKTITATVVNGVAEVNVTIPTAWYTNKSNLSARYNGNYAINTNTSSNTTMNVSLRNATIQLLAEAGPFKAGDTVKLRVIVQEGDTLVSNGVVSFKLNGLTLRYANGSAIYANVRNGVGEVTWTIPDGYTAATYNLTGVFGGGIYERNERSTSITVAKAATHLNVSVYTTNTSKIRITADIFDGNNIRETGNSRISVKIAGSTVLSSVTVTNGRIDLNVTLNLRAGLYTVEIIAGENSAYQGTRTTTYLIRT